MANVFRVKTQLRLYLGLLTGLALLQPLASFAAFDAFLKLDGVEGESTDAAHKGEIEISSFSWGITQSGVTDVTGRLAGRADFSALVITKKTDKSSPIIYLHCANGTHIKNATIVLRKAGEKQLEYLKIKITDVIVTGAQVTGGTGSETPTESISFNFATIEWEYIPQNESGGVESPVKAGWDLKAGKKV